MYTPKTNWVSKHIDKRMYHDMYMKGKRNALKNKHVLLENIHKTKAKETREKTLSDNFDTKIAKKKVIREKMFTRK